eukprot:5631857-Amphidinium_carterae.2
MGFPKDPMPWKRRLPGGVKWTSPPFGFANLHDVAQVHRLTNHGDCDLPPQTVWELSVVVQPGATYETMEVLRRRLENSTGRENSSLPNCLQRGGPHVIVRE